MPTTVSLGALMGISLEDDVSLLEQPVASESAEARTEQSAAYLVLVDAKSPQDQLAIFYGAVVRALRAKGADIELYFFQHGPEYGCWQHKETDDSPSLIRSGGMSWEAVVTTFATRHLVLLSQAQVAYHPDTGEPSPWAIKDAKQFASRTLLTCNNRSDWGKAESVMTAPDFMGFTVTPALLSDAVPGPYPQLLNDDQSTWAFRLIAPPAARINELLGQLSQYLGPSGMELLCAYSRSPTKSWMSTMQAAKAMGEQSNAQKEHAQLREVSLMELHSVLCLPWFRYGAMPDWFIVALAAMEQEPSLLGTVLRAAKALIGRSSR